MQTSFLRKCCLAVGVALLSVCAANANLIINGSFETHPTFTRDGGTWDLFGPGQVSGWDPAPGSPDIELGFGTTYGVTGYDGLVVMELDSTANVTVQQNLGALGGSYTLSFLYALRKNQTSESCSFDVLWNGALVTSVSPTVVPTSTVMSLFTTTVTGSTVSTVNTLQFRGAGASNSYGALVDAVQLVAVPEPSTCVAGALLLLPFLLSTVRHLRK